MRDSFARAMVCLAKSDPAVVLLSGDIGNRMFDEFKDVAPGRFFNCGIAEANMMSVAAGLGLSGMKPVVYTIAPFTTIRCLEQIKISVAYNDSPVIIVGTGSGLSYAELGPTHHSCEDLACLRSIPNMNVLAPADSLQLVGQLRESLNSRKPSYIRIGKKGEPDLHTDSHFEIGKAHILRHGSDLLIIGIGPILSEALDAARKLSEQGISVAVANMGGVKPLDEAFLRSMTVKFKKWISLEEHSINGGLFSSITEWLLLNNVSGVRISPIAIPDKFIHHLGKQAYMRKELGLDSSSIIRVASKFSQSRG